MSSSPLLTRPHHHHHHPHPHLLSSFLPYLLLIFLTLIASSDLLLQGVQGQYVIVDFSASSRLPSRMIGLASATDLGRRFPTSEVEVNLIALPEDNIFACHSITSLPATVSSSKTSKLVVLARRGNCTFVEKMRQVQAAGGYALGVVNEADKSVFEMSSNIGADVSDITIPSFMLTRDAGDLLFQVSWNQSLPSDLKVGKLRQPAPNLISARIHAYERSQFDFTFIVMLVLAVATVMYAAYLSAAEERHVKNVRRAGVAGVNLPRAAPVVAGEESPSAQYLTTQHAFGFIVMASVMLLILFFFIRYLIYVLIFAFCMGGLQSITHLGTTFLRWIHPSYTRTMTLPIFGTVSIYMILSFTLGLILTLSWAITRNQPGAWVLQDILGISLLLVLQQSLRLPDIKVSTILLSMAFLYDIFWVFLSAYFFRESVMVAVAKGGGTGEAVPMLLRIPRIQDEVGGYSMLGLGDIALPGLFISYLLRFDYSHPDINRTWKKSYFLPASFGYALGLICTYIALMVSEHGQPALLYLVPCTLGVILPMAWLRGDLKEMWRGSPERRDSANPLRATSPTSTAISRPATNGAYSAVSTAANGAVSGSQHDDHDHEEVTHHLEGMEIDSVGEDEQEMMNQL